jgi:tRNA A37 threonylcarbamoyladenosine dehydratase
MSEKQVMAKIGRQYVKLVAEKIMEIEKGQRELKELVAKVLQTQIENLSGENVDKVIDLLHRTEYVLDRYRWLTREISDLKQYIKGVLESGG